MSRALILKKRALFLKKVRSFFDRKGVFEIDVPSINRFASIDAYIDPIEVDLGRAFLHTSPEYLLKRLLAEGVEDCYYLGHVFRKEEVGKLHSPEFTMLEWYRKGFSYDRIIEETAQVLSIFFSGQKIEKIGYSQAFRRYAGIDIERDDIREKTQLSWSKKEILHFLLAEKIEPLLGRNALTVLTDFPPEEAALSRIENGVAKRFEIYFRGIELANGYLEESDPEILKKRFEKSNETRKALGKKPYAIDFRFLEALKTLPPCTGVALGFDRALMLALQKSRLEEVLPFPWDRV